MKLLITKLIMSMSAIMVIGVTEVQASPVYSSDFIAGTTTNFTLPSYASIVQLPTDSGGFGNSPLASWLKIDSQQNKFVDETATLSLSGLTSGKQYTVNLDLFIGASWDGSAFSYGPDEWKLYVNSGSLATQTLVDATFANGQQGINFGADSRQSYSDQNPVAGTGLLFNRFEGADASFSKNIDGNYASDYSIYSFSHGVGNPTLTFIADGNNASLTFQRKGIGSGDSGDEYWALGNIQVESTTPVPEPETYAMMLAGLGLIGFMSRSRKSV